MTNYVDLAFITLPQNILQLKTVGEPSKKATHVHISSVFVGDFAIELWWLWSLMLNLWDELHSV